MENVFDSSYKGYKLHRKWLIGLLKETEVKVTFTKKDGTERVMFCTLHEDCTPQIEPDETKNNDEVLAVYDVDKIGWRSFRWDSIKKIEFTLGD